MRPSGDMLAAATGALTRLGCLTTGGANQPAPSSLSSVTAASCTICQPSCARALGSAPGEHSLRSWAAVCAYSFAAAATLTSTRDSRRLLDVIAFQLLGASRLVASPPRRWYSSPLQRHPSVARADVAKVRGQRRVLALAALVDEQRGEHVEVTMPESSRDDRSR